MGVPHRKNAIPAHEGSSQAPRPAALVPPSPAARKRSRMGVLSAFDACEACPISVHASAYPGNVKDVAPPVEVAGRGVAELPCKQGSVVHRQRTACKGTRDATESVVTSNGSAQGS